MSDDERWLARAVGLAARALPDCRPNPPVGCVVVRDGVAVGEGWTQQVGGPHAEVVALRAAGTSARGATAYVALEPCDHVGRTGPCTQALRAAGVERVVLALHDPDPQAAGGAATLRTAGVPAGLLPLGGWAEQAPAAFLQQRRTGLPRVVLKLAITPDGAHVASDGRWITGEVARRRVHRLRAAADAVLVGSGTVLADDPGLDVRHVPHVGPQPRPVVLDAGLRTPPSATVVARGALVVTVPDSDVGTASAEPSGAREPSRPARRAALVDGGATVVDVPPGVAGGVDVAAALAAVAHLGVQSVLAEPGPTLASALLREGLVQRLLLHVGGVGSEAALAAAQHAPLPLDAMALDGAARLGDDVELRLAPAGRTGGAGGTGGAGARRS